MRKNLIRLLTLGVLTMTTAFLSGCGSKGSDEEIVIWTFTDELKDMTAHYQEQFPDVKVKVEATPIASLVTKLDNALRTGKNLPDMVALEEKILRKYIDSGKLESLNDIAESSAADNMYDYTINQAKNESGEVLGLAWQATPGAYFYRRSIAKSLWGNDSPEFVQGKVDSWTNFLATAEELKAHKDTRILSSLTEPAKVFYAQRDCGWVNNKNELTISENLYNSQENLFDVMQKLQGNGTSTLYVNETTEWNSGWFADMSSDKVFGFFLSSWGLHYNLKANATNANTGISTAGDWGVVEGPGSFADGGTWLATLKTSDKKDECKELIKYFTTNEEFLTKWARETGDFMNNKAVMNTVKEGHSEEFLGGQNHFEILFNAAAKLEGNHLTKYDQNLNGTFNEWAINYAMGDFDKNSAILEFKNSVSQQYTNIIVK